VSASVRYVERLIALLLDFGHIPEHITGSTAAIAATSTAVEILQQLEGLLLQHLEDPIPVR